MNNLKKTIARLFCIALLLAPWTLAQALETFQQAGMIANIEYDKITIKGKDYRPGSGVEVISDDATRSSFNAFKKGDLIYVEGTLLNGTRYVDIIRYETPDEN